MLLGSLVLVFDNFIWYSGLDAFSLYIYVSDIYVRVGSLQHFLTWKRIVVAHSN